MKDIQGHWGSGMSLWESQAWSCSPLFPHLATLQAQAASLHPAQLLVMTSAAAAHHHHPAQGCSGQGLDLWPLGSKKPPGQPPLPARRAATPCQPATRLLNVAEESELNPSP